MREGQEFQDWTNEWSEEQDARLRTSLGALRHDVDAAGIPDVRFVMKRAGRQRHRAVVGIAAGAAAVLGLSWFGYQALDNTPGTAPAGDGTATEPERTQDPTDGQETDGGQTGDPTEGTEAAPVDPADLVVSESGGPDVSLFVPPALWASEVFTDGDKSEAVTGWFETTGMFGCDPDDVYWGTPEEGTFGMLWLTDDSTNVFATQRVRVLESSAAADDYAAQLNGALGDCQAPAEADNVVFEVEPLELSGAYRFTTTFVDGSDAITEFVYVFGHEGTPEAVSTIRVTDWSKQVTDDEAAAELERLSDLVIGN